MVHAKVTADNPRLTEALKYAAMGLPVIPLHEVDGNGVCSCKDGKTCGHQGKHPRTGNGSKDGTTDHAKIREWWDSWPNANVGVCTGWHDPPMVSVFMVGPDGQAGIDALAELERQHSPLPRSPRSKSGSGGRHLLFRNPPHKNIKNHRNHQDLPIDVRGKGGLFVAPPSRNKNGEYRWEISVDECEIPDAPEWLLAWCDLPTKRKRKAEKAPKKSALTMRPSRGASIEDRAIAYLAKMPEAISRQGGHDRTFDAARVVVYGFDLGVETGLRILLDHYNPRCQPEWSEAELRHKCEEADTVEYSKPRGWLLHERNGFLANGYHHTNGTAPVSPSKAHTQADQDDGPHLSDLGNARRMVKLHGIDLRHCQPWHKWHVWDGKRWRQDNTFSATRCAKSVTAEMYRWAQQEIQKLSEESEDDASE
jgi:hypothetical protein